MSIRFASRVLNVPGSGIREVMAKAMSLRAAGKDVINWHVGRPDFDTPRHIKEACSAALAAGHVHYAPASGIPELRQAIATQAEIEYGASSGSVSPDRVVVCNGGMEAVTVVLHSMLEAGDEVIMPTPNWPNMKWAVQLAGGSAVEVPLEKGILSADAINRAITSKTRMIVLSSPGNPSGMVASKAALERIASLVKAKGLLVLSDETYTRLYHGHETSSGVAPTIAAMPGMLLHTIVVNTFSKTYAMDGWRLGWALLPSAEDATVVAKTRYYYSSCSPTFTQHAAVTALTASQDCVAQMVAEYNRRRNVLLDGLRSIPGITIPGGEPEGAYYVFPDVSSFGYSSAEIARILLEDHHIALVEGGVFGLEGEGHLRISYSCSTEECKRGVDRLAAAFKKIRG